MPAPRAYASIALTADGVVSATGPCRLMGILCWTNGTNNTTAILYDNASAATGTVRGRGGCVGANLVSYIDFGPNGVGCSNGLYLDITTTSGGCIVFFDQR